MARLRSERQRCLVNHGAVVAKQSARYCSRRRAGLKKHHVGAAYPDAYRRHALVRHQDQEVKKIMLLNFSA